MLLKNRYVPTINNVSRYVLFEFLLCFPLFENFVVKYSSYDLAFELLKLGSSYSLAFIVYDFLRTSLPF